MVVVVVVVVVVGGSNSSIIVADAGNLAAPNGPNILHIQELQNFWDKRCKISLSNVGIAEGKVGFETVHSECCVGVGVVVALGVVVEGYSRKRGNSKSSCSKSRNCRSSISSEAATVLVIIGEATTSVVVVFCLCSLL